VLCVATEEPVADWAVEVRVCSPATLADVMTSGPAGLSPKHVTDAVSLLSGETSPTEDEAEAIAAEVADLPAEVDADSAEAAPAAVPKTTKRRGRAPVPVPAAEDAPDAKAGKDPAKKRRSLVKPIVLLALVAALLAGGPKVYPSVKAMVAEQLSGGTPACVPAAVPTPAAATSAHAAKPGTKKKSAAKPARSKKARLAARRAAAEKRALAQTQALAGPAC
jgi:hypothetical protein